MPFFALYLPVIYLYLKGAGVVLHLGVLAALVLLARTTGTGSLEFLGYLLNGVAFGYVFAWSFQKGLPVFYSLLLSLLPGLVFLTLCTEVPVYRVAYGAILTDAARLVDGKFGLPALSPELLSLQRDWLFPAGEIIKDAVTVFLLALIFYRAAGRTRPMFSGFTVPEGFIWALAAGLTAALAGWGGHAVNLWLVTAGLLYALGGFAVIRLFYERIGKSRFAEWFFYLVQPGLLFVPVVVIGLLQTWLGFRGRIENWETPGNAGQ
ncbi:MAG: hypothetical protein V1913_12725 [Fibrobacterota bacterium]